MKFGVIGGSGLYEMEGLTGLREEKVDTPFGEPSDIMICGKINGVEMYFLPRHGRGHRILPSEINYRANIMAFKMLGVERVISISAVGSLKEELRPRDIVLPDQYFDRTKNSPAHTFFGEGIVAHVPFAYPGCGELRDIIDRVARRVISLSSDKGRRVQKDGTYVNMEGPAFSTRAEADFHRRLGFDVIGMTSLAEAKLCREAEMCYQAIALVTDYDCWHETEEAVSLEMILGHLKANTDLAMQILPELVKEIGPQHDCACGDMLKYAIVTERKAMREETVRKLAPIIGKYVQ